MVAIGAELHVLVRLEAVGLIVSWRSIASRKLIRVVLSLAVFSASAPLFAQTETGRILGGVFDQTGAV